jgi:alkylation response protein AidB-like acyl-CoA dehydrogenase
VPDFTLSDEQEMLRDTARALFTKECPSSLVRAAFYDVTEDGPAAAAALHDTYLREWAALGDGSLVDLCLFLEEAGTAIAPGPTWVSTSFALPLLRAAGHPDADAVGSGELAATVAMAGSAGRWEPNDEPAKWFVPHVDTVDRVVFVHPGPTIVVHDAAEVERHPIEALDRTRPLFRVEVPGGGAATGITESQLEDGLRRATVALSAELVGVGRWLQEATVEYVKERVQFDRPVGSFQGLQWKLVDAALVQERATAAVYYAAMCVDAASPDARAAAHVAKAAAGTAARRWSRDGLQAHGGIGFTWEHDLHLRLRRAYGGDHLLGDADHHHDRLAELMFDRS